MILYYGLSHVCSHKCQVPDCQMAFPTTYELARHEKYKHQKDKPYQCSHCDKTFVEKSKLIRHNQAHKVEKERQRLSDEGLPDTIYSPRKRVKNWSKQDYFARNVTYNDIFGTTDYQKKFTNLAVLPGFSVRLAKNYTAMVMAKEFTYNHKPEPNWAVKKQKNKEMKIPDELETTNKKFKEFMTTPAFFINMYIGANGNAKKFRKQLKENLSNENFQFSYQNARNITKGLQAWCQINLLNFNPELPVFERNARVEKKQKVMKEPKKPGLKSENNQPMMTRARARKLGQKIADLEMSF